MMAAPPLSSLGDSQLAGSVGKPRVSNASRAASTRTDLLNAFFEAMNRAGIPYCVLNGFENYPEVIESDVDFMVNPADLGQIQPLLLEVARECDALLVQCMQHETGAWYFVVAKQVGGEVAYLHPDCSADYRRDGRLWLAAQAALQGRQAYKTFFVPEAANEFQYYLIKKVLKQRMTSRELRRLATLYRGNPEECCKRIRQFWSKGTSGALVSAVLRPDDLWMQSYLPALLLELRRSSRLENWWQRAVQQVREHRRRVQRVTNPTGMRICVSGGSSQERTELATALEKNLRPAFRRTRIVLEKETGRLRLAASIWLAKVRSTLVIQTKAVAPPQWLRWADICFELSDASLQDTEQATRVTLEWMAERMRGRLRCRQTKVLRGSPLAEF